jgi:uncharacterized protein YhjY with autotransporter beta-barrel domain
MSISTTSRFFIFSAILGFSSVSFAQESDLPLGAIGETELQKRMGNGVQTVCGQFIANQDFSESAQRSDLFDRCGEMVHTALGLEIDSSKSLGITLAELANVLQEVAGEEAMAQGSIATDTMSGQNALIGSRISGLLTRLARANYSDSDDFYGNNSRILGMGASGDDFGLNENFSVFANVSVGNGEKDATDRENGFDLDGTTFLVGADYRLNESSVIGATIGFEGYDADYTKNQRVSGGDMSVDTTTLSLYGLYSQENYFMSGIIGFGNSDFDTSRSVQYSSNNPNNSFNGANRQLSSKSDSSQYNVSLTMGYQMINGSRTISPYVKLSYLDVEIDEFGEVDSSGGGLGLQYSAQNIESFKGILGVQASWVINQDFGVFSPYVIAELHNEFKDDPDTVTFQYIHDPRNNQISLQSDAADSNFFNFTVGSSLILPNSFQLHADISSVVGFEDFDYTSINVGVRKAF